VFRFQASDGGTLARSEESWEGLLASLLKGYSRRTLDKGIRSVLAHLKAAWYIADRPGGATSSTGAYPPLFDASEPSSSNTFRISISPVAPYSPG
jgi:hypothetical protein